MKGKRSLLTGILLGFLVSAMAFPVGMTPFVVCFIAFATLLVFTIVSMTLLALTGWPPPSENFDVYDLHRVILGGSMTIGALAFIAAATSKISTALSLSIGWSFCFALAGLVAYAAMFFGFLTYARR